MNHYFLFFLIAVQWLFIVETFKLSYNVFGFNALLISSPRKTTFFLLPKCPVFFIFPTKSP